MQTLQIWTDALTKICKVKNIMQVKSIPYQFIV